MMWPVQLTPMDQQKNNAKENVSRGRWSLKAMVWIVLLAVIILTLRPPAILTATAMLDRPNPQIGSKSAPVTIVEFGDFGCSSCQIWAAAGMRQQLLNKYGNKVRFVWADFPIVTLESPKAAEAGRCAYDQGRFWEYQDYIYNNYQGISIVYLKIYASRIGLDRAIFDQCLDSGAKAAEVNLDFNDAMLRALSGTPTFLINNKVVLVGMAPLDKFAAIIDPILAGAH
jgi:protein-disulfide isomerase